MAKSQQVWAPVKPKKDYTGFNFPNLQKFVTAQNVAKVAQPPVPAGAPAPAPAPTLPSLNSGALPIDLQVGVDNATAGAAATYRNTVTGTRANQDRAASDYGYSPTYAVNGDTRDVTSLTVDPSNPYSRAAALQRSYDQSKAGSTNSMAARGQLYSGALQNAQNENTRRFGEGDNANRQGFLDFITRTNGDIKSAGVANANAGPEALRQAILAASSRTPETPAPTQADAATVAAQLAPAAPAASAAPAKPKGSDWNGSNVFLQNGGSRAGVWYRVVKQGGSTFRFYSNGDKVKV